MSGFDYSDLEAFQNKIIEAYNVVDKEFMDCANEIARTFIKKVMHRTPISDLPTKGHLRRNWKAKVIRSGNSYMILVWNPVRYAPFVEKGHRTVMRIKKPSGKVAHVVKNNSWVNGRFMMKITRDEIAKDMPRQLKKIENRLETLLNEL